MTQSEEIVKRLKVAILPWTSHMTEKKMFGGYCLLFKGKMCIGETKERLMVRVKPDKMQETLALPHVTPMDFTGKPMKESVFVTQEGFKTEAQLQYFIELGIAHAEWKLSQ
ncbi:MAG: hypothetical protein CMC70_07525 [Flavobacteriaceae bacterium]|nr:hypothetical protein [Flavobacteriaceae bacterium]